MGQDAFGRGGEMTAGNRMGMQGDYSSHALHKLQFRRQFVLGADFVKEFPSWTRLNVDRTFRLSVHPDLGVCQVAAGNKSITLLGYILDPNNPQADNTDILNALIRKLDRCSDCWRYTCEFGGRWALIVNDGQETILFHDAGGLRSVYYTTLSNSRPMFCASQPGLIATALNLEMDKEALEYIHSREFDHCEVYWLPGDATMYENIRALLPNHYVNLHTGQSQRFWPDADLKSIPRGEVMEESSRLLRGLMASARHRFGLALSLTAGWDSRVNLALSKDMIRDLYCFTLTYPHAENSRDVTVPAELLKKLGMKHSLIRYPENVNADFKRIYQRSIDAANDAYCADAQAMYDQYPESLVCITGDVAEIVKCYFRLPKLKQNEVTASDLAELCGIGTHPFLIEAFRRWLSGCDPHNVHPLDLFCWEQFSGRKQALIRAQYDIAHESVAPFNCRSLLVTMLSVDEEYRRPPKYLLLTDLIKLFWSDILCVPINPPEKVRARNLAIGILKRLRIYQLVPESAKRFAKYALKRSGRT